MSSVDRFARARRRPVHCRHLPVRALWLVAVLSLVVGLHGALAAPPAAGNPLRSAPAASPVRAQAPPAPSSDPSAENNEAGDGPELLEPQPAADADRSQAPVDEPAAPLADAQPGREDLRNAARAASSASSEADYSEIIERARRAVQAGLSPENKQYARTLMAWAHNRRGAARSAAGADQEALDDFDQAVRLDSGNWRALHNRGVSQALAGNQANALADFTRTIQLNDRHANAYFNRGELLYERGEFRAAIADYNLAIRYAPRDAAAYNSRGHAHYRLNEVRQALADYSKAIELDPAGAAAFTNRGDAYVEVGEYRRALADYRTAMKLDPQMGRAYQSTAWLLSTCPLDEFRDARSALAAAKKAIQLDGDEDVRYLETLAAAQASLGDFEAAAVTQAQAVQMAPAAERPRYRERQALYQQGSAYREPIRQATHRTPPARSVLQ